MNINIVNQRHHNKRPNDIYIGRPTALGNPYLITNLIDRDSSINLFRRDFYSLLTLEKSTKFFNLIEVKKQLHQIKIIAMQYGSVNLVCWCAPLPCHGSIIAEYFHNMNL